MPGEYIFDSFKDIWDVIFMQSLTMLVSAVQSQTISNNSGNRAFDGIFKHIILM